MFIGGEWECGEVDVRVGLCSRDEPEWRKLAIAMLEPSDPAFGLDNHGLLHRPVIAAHGREVRRQRSDVWVSVDKSVSQE